MHWRSWTSDKQPGRQTFRLQAGLLLSRVHLECGGVEGRLPLLKKRVRSYPPAQGLERNNKKAPIPAPRAPATMHNASEMGGGTCQTFEKDFCA